MDGMDVELLKLAGLNPTRAVRQPKEAVQWDHL